MIHGGDIYRNQVQLDYSVNLNPLGVPASVKDAVKQAVERCDVYPDGTALELRQGISEHFQLNPEQIICGNGASELFLAVVHACSPKRILIPVPSFYGYQWAAQAAGAEIRYYYLKSEDGFALDRGILEEFEDIDMIFLANPNNPTGSYIDEALLTEILKACMQKRIMVVLDECFMELSTSPKTHSRIRECQKWSNLLLVRAFTKSFAIPAIRLGYLAGSNIDVLENIRRQLPEWNTSRIAQEAGIAALREGNYLEQARAVIREERKFLIRELAQIGITVYPSETNYLLIYTDTPLQRQLLKAQILIRDCSNFIGLQNGYYRIAVKGHAENVRLLEEIRKSNCKGT